jgi:hypothetical protein
MYYWLLLPIERRIHKLYMPCKQQLGKTTTLQMLCTEDLKQILPEMKLQGLVPNFYIHVSLNDLYIPTIGPQTQYSKIG